MSKIVKLPISSTEQRLDKRLQSLEYPWTYFSRSAWDELFEKGKIKTLSGKKIKAGERSNVTEILLELDAFEMGPSSGGIEILAKEDGYLAVNKPANIHSLPHRPWEKDTLVNRIFGFLNSEKKFNIRNLVELAEAPSLESGLVQRLDFETSGIIIFALTNKTKSLLRQEFGASKFAKEYFALVQGVPNWKSTEIRGVLDQSQGDKSTWLSAEQGKELSGANVSVLALGTHSALVKIRTTEGGRHIVRVAMAHLGLPLLGDTKYGADPQNFPHQLHAIRLQYLGNELGLEQFKAGINCQAPESFWKVAEEFAISRI